MLKKWPEGVEKIIIKVQEKKLTRKVPLLQPAAPPLIPHRVFMRENCLVCHGDSSRREIIQTRYSERLNCVQCHVEQDIQAGEFKSNMGLVGFSNL